MIRTKEVSFGIDENGTPTKTTKLLILLIKDMEAPNEQNN